MGSELIETARLLEIMRALRDPETGCPWDVEQTHQTLRKYVIEEAYEVAEAIDVGDEGELIKELGDLLLQVVFHAEIGRGEKRFDFESIAKAVGDKMIERHPHVFGDAGPRSAAEQTNDWERIKAAERGAQATLEGVSKALPALTRAYKLQKRAARVGFDWADPDDARAKIDEELAELAALGANRNEEFGDLLFAIVNYGRKIDLDPEEELMNANAKFSRRFEYIENALAQKNKTPQDATLEEMEALWLQAKLAETSG